VVDRGVEGLEIRSILRDGREQPACLVSIDDDAPVDRDKLARRPPVEARERVGIQVTTSYCVLDRHFENLPASDDGVPRGRPAVHPPGQRAEGRAAAPRGYGHPGLSSARAGVERPARQGLTDKLCELCRHGSIEKGLRDNP
jgi:hypothetical protein